MKQTVDFFKNKVAIVTGGGSGIGAALSRELCSRGATVIVADISVERAERTCVSVEGGGKMLPYRLDVTEGDSINKLLAETVEKWGFIHYMFNNAGILVAGEVRDMGFQHWREIVEVNILGVANGSVAAYLYMSGQGFGHIINIASLSGLISSPLYAAYAMTKSAVIGLSKALRSEGAALGIRVSVVCPGNVRTGIFEDSTVVNADRESMFKPSVLKHIEPVEAARQILAGVIRNEAVIIFPFYARLMWWLDRVNSSLLNPLHAKVLQNSRTLRSKQ